MDSQENKKPKMSKQKKTIIALSSVCSVVAIALITVVSVWAATSQTVTSTLTITYSAKNVSATVTAEYKLEGDTTYTTLGSTSFLPKDASGTKSLQKDDALALTDTKSYAIFKYTFTNDGDNSFKVALNETEVTKSNVTVTFASADVTDEPASITGTTFAEATVAGHATIYAYVKVAVTDLASSANYTGTLNWVLTSVEAAA